MTYKDEELFRLFLRETSEERGISQRVDLAFRITVGDVGGVLEVVDRKTQEVVEPSYLQYTGPERQLLRTLEQIQERGMFMIEWDQRAGEISLVDHPYLMRLLRDCPRVVDKAGKTLRFASEPGQLVLRLQPDGEDIFRCAIHLEAQGQRFDQFTHINEEYILADGWLAEVAPVGPRFKMAEHLHARVTRSNLPLFLSLVYSHLGGIRAWIDGYRVEEASLPAIAMSPCLIFEKIDEANQLYMRVGQQLPGIDFLALEQYELIRYAEVQAHEGLIRIRPVEPRLAEEVIAPIQQMLRRHQSAKGRKKHAGKAILLDNQFVIPEDLATAFIQYDLPALLDTHIIYGAEKLQSYRLYTKAPAVQAQLQHGLDFLEGDVLLEFDGELIPLFDALRQFHKNAYVQLSDGRRALLNQSYVKRLERIFKKKGKKARLSIFDLPLAEELIADSDSEKAFAATRKVYEGFNALTAKRGRLPAVKATLRPYQRHGYQWLRYLHEHKLGGCLADDMGLGKTLQTITLLAGLYPAEKRPTLIVMPRSLLFNWAREVERFAPRLQTYTYYGADRDLRRVRESQLIFTTYATMRNDIEGLAKIPFYYVVLDESQHIKNIDSQTTRAALMLKCEHRLALSGTPVENNLGELYALFRFLNPSMFGTIGQFQEDYLTPIQKHQDAEATRQLRLKIYPFILRRLKRDVLQDLPDKTEKILYVEMDDAQRTLYEQRRQYYAAAIGNQISEKGIRGAQFFIFQALSELRQIASIPETLTGGQIRSAKLGVLEEQLADALANGHKVLIFVQFLGAIESISERLEAEGVGFVSMTGATRDRQRLVQQFQEDPDCRVFLMTLKTGGVGLNLTAADTIFIYDPWWNVAAENQAIDRAHRIGQINKVLACKLIAAGTIEEKMLQLQQIKKALFDSILADDSSGPKNLTEEDIQMLLAQ